MLGFVASAFAYGAVKAAAVGARRHEVADGWDFGLNELSEELVFRVGLERGLGLAGLGAVPVRLLQAGIFGLMHENTADAALGGLLYGAAYDRHGLLGSTLTHVAHNLGVYLAAK